jgi:hypothetical protein
LIPHRSHIGCTLWTIRRRRSAGAAASKRRPSCAALLVLIAGIAALVPLLFVFRRPTSGTRLIAETFAVTLLIIAAF